MHDMCKEYRHHAPFLFGDFIPAGNPEAKNADTRRAWWGHKKERFDRFADEVDKLVGKKDQKVLQRLKDFHISKADLLACLKLNKEKEHTKENFEDVSMKRYSIQWQKQSTEAFNTKQMRLFLRHVESNRNPACGTRHEEAQKVANKI